jgi:hypothetical protein
LDQLQIEQQQYDDLMAIVVMFVDFVTVNEK